MKSSLRPTTVADFPAVRQFLQRAFNSSEDAPFLDPALMKWKYWDSRHDWSDPRAYVLEREGAIVAHAGIYPVTFAGGEVKGIQMVDWASSSGSPGAGLALLQKLTSMFDFVYSIGGSEMTSKILPAYGFPEYVRQWKGARPLRPLQLTATHQQRDWKLAPRLARRFLWASPKMREGRLPSGWSTREISPDELDETLFSCSISETYFSPRPRTFFEYLLRCPSMTVRLYGIFNQAKPVGHFVVGVMRGQARVGGVWLLNPDPAAWKAAYALAQFAALQHKEAYELAAAGTEGASEQGATTSGLRVLGYTPVYLMNKKGKLSLPKDFQFQLADDDVFCLDLGRSDYWT